MRIGILGDGQLGRMLALAAHPMNVSVVSAGESVDGPNREVLPHVVLAPEDEAGFEAFARSVDVLTYESENTDVGLVRRLNAVVPVHPGPRALEIAQDRVFEKTYFNECGVETAPWSAVDGLDDLLAAAERTGLPGVLKTRRFGYDGKGQRVVQTAAELPAALAELGGSGLIWEGFVRFSRELSIIGTRGADGTFVAWPIAENTHRDGILRVSRVWRGIVPATLQEAASRALHQIMAGLDYVGTIALELFEVDGRVLANEMAPRVHNSGHWTIEGSVTSQFENHVRALAGLPLGDTTQIRPCAMVNLIGRAPEAAEILAIPGAHYHHYGKSARRGRKIGHVTVEAPDVRALEEALERVQAVVRRSENG